MKKEKKPAISMGFKNNPMENKMLQRPVKLNEIQPKPEDELANDNPDSSLPGGGGPDLPEHAAD